MRPKEKAGDILTARAKLNLTLEVFEQEDDGYHRLRSLMQKLTLADRIFIQPSRHGEDTLSCDDRTIPGGTDNIVLKAVFAYRKKTGLNFRFSIFLEKQIPHGAGLGGGSSDAAAILRYLNKKAAEHGHLPLEDNELTQLAADIGADVPFCLSGITDLASGIGESLLPQKTLPPYPVILLSPKAQISTAEAFSRLDQQRKEHRSDRQIYAHEAIYRRLFEGRKVGGILPNSFLPVVDNLPIIREVDEELLKNRAVLAGGMSGSGPTCFLLFRGTEAQVETAARLKIQLPGVKIIKCALSGQI